MTNDSKSNATDSFVITPMAASMADVESPPPLPAQPWDDWRYWVKRLLVCNPFFLCSAALLLFAINRLSVDPNFLANETHNLLFNFSALQFYEVLLVATALVLARRCIWYDSALLVVMENGLVLVPFLLLSQAALIGKEIAWGLTLGGGAIAICRFLALRRFYPQFNLPWRALLLGATILIANAALPRIFRPWVDGDLAEWAFPNLIAWWLVLPFFAAGANLLPRPVSYHGNNAARPWLPLLLYSLWIAGSAVHVWCLAHICSLPMQSQLLAPLALVCAWTLYNRLSDCMPVPWLTWRNTVLLLAFACPLLGVQNPHLFFPLCAINFLGYCLLWMIQSRQIPTIAKELALASFPLMLAGMPAEWGRGVAAELNRSAWLAEISRPQLILMGGFLYCAFCCLRSRSVKAGVLGAMAIFGLVAGFASYRPFGSPLQIALVYLLLHSMRWPESGSIEFRRYCIASLWLAHSFLWTWDGRLNEGAIVAGGALLILLIWLITWRWSSAHGPWLFPIAAFLSLLCPPLNWFKDQNSEGVIALAASFLLFAIGFLVAWTKHRWQGKEKLEVGTVNTNAN